jgi:hypothetical protein
VLVVLHYFWTSPQRWKVNCIAVAADYASQSASFVIQALVQG